MIIDSLSIRNYRLFEDVSISFASRLSVIVGVNGAGKSTVLDAMCHLLNCYIGGFDDRSVSRIDRSDIRYVTYDNGSTFENVAQLPVELSAMGTIASKSVSWKSVKAKDSTSSSSPSAYASITTLAREHQDRIRQGDTSLQLPLIAYYGTGRLWAQETSKRRLVDQLNVSFGRLNGYDECLDAHLTDAMLASWFERMTYKSLQLGKDVPVFATVRQAVEKSMKSLTGFSNVSIESNLDTHQLDVIYEEDRLIRRTPSSQLSDGYRVALNLFADIAYRAAVLNPQLGEAALERTEGIVLIDEVDLHLHPQWQQLVLSDLVSTFPKMQFVVTTHAPAVISSVQEGQLIVVEGDSIYSSSQGFYGRDVNTILREIMGVPERPRAVKSLFSRFYDLVDAGDYARAEKVLTQLSSLVGDSDVELTACNVQLDLERMSI